MIRLLHSGLIHGSGVCQIGVGRRLLLPAAEPGGQGRNGSQNQAGEYRQHAAERHSRPPPFPPGKAQASQPHQQKQETADCKQDGQIQGSVKLLRLRQSRHGNRGRPVEYGTRNSLVHGFYPPGN